MADYHSPTVVQPNIPAADMTPLERLILDLVFDAAVEDDGIYFHSWCGPSSVVTIAVDELRSATDASREYGETTIGEKSPLYWPSTTPMMARMLPTTSMSISATVGGTGCFRTSCAGRQRSTRSSSRRRSPARRCGRTASAAA